jgi:hypothetical protein
MGSPVRNLEVIENVGLLVVALILWLHKASKLKY